MRSRPMLVAARVTAAEKALIVAAAEAEGLPVSEYILRSVIAQAALQDEPAAGTTGTAKTNPHERRTA